MPRKARLDAPCALWHVIIRRIERRKIFRCKEARPCRQLWKEREAHKLIDRMPPDATWDDLMREIYLREAIERGLADSKMGRTKDVKEVRAKYGLPE
jgi:hypothetical protein